MMRRLCTDLDPSILTGYLTTQFRQHWYTAPCPVQFCSLTKQRKSDPATRQDMSMEEESSRSFSLASPYKIHVWYGCHKGCMSVQTCWTALLCYNALKTGEAWRVRTVWRKSGARELQIEFLYPYFTNSEAQTFGLLPMRYSFETWWRNLTHKLCKRKRIREKMLTLDNNVIGPSFTLKLEFHKSGRAPKQRHHRRSWRVGRACDICNFMRERSYN